MGVGQQLRLNRSGPPLSVQVEDTAEGRALRCSGELDIASEEALRRTIATALGRTVTYLILDLRELSFADITAFRVIEYAQAACTRCHVVLYVEPGEKVRAVAHSVPEELLGHAADYVLDDRR